MDAFNATFDRIAAARGLAGIQPSDPRWDEIQAATAAELGIRECSRCGDYGIYGDSRECVECGRDGSYCISDVDQACWCHECTVYAAEAEAHWRPLYEGERLAGLLPSPLWIENDRALKQLTADLAAIDAEMTRRGL